MMAIITRNKPFMFTIFNRDSEYLMTVVTGGVAMYELTVRLSAEEVVQFQADENKAIAMAKDLATRTSAYENRMVRPSVDPS